MEIDRPALGSLYSNYNCYRRNDVVRIVGYTKARVIVEAVKVINDSHIDGGNDVIDEQWLKDNPVKEVKKRSSPNHTLMMIKKSDKGEFYLTLGQDWYSFVNNVKAVHNYCSY